MFVNKSSFLRIVSSLVLSCGVVFCAGCGTGSSIAPSGSSVGAAVSDVFRSPGEWSLVGDPFGSGYAKIVSALGVDTTGVLYATGGSGSVARSNNGGVTWTQIGAGLPNATVQSIGVNSLNEPIVGVGANPPVGIYRYTKGSWHKASGASATLFFSAFTLDKTGALIVVTSWGGDVFRSTDNGATFVKTASNIGPGAAMWTVTRAPDGSLWAGGESANGAFRSVDNGITWHSVGLSSSSGYKGNIFAITFNALHQPLVGRPAGTTDLQLYTGLLWAPASTGLPPYKNIHSLLLTSKGRILAGLDDSTPGLSMFRSLDGGLTWTTYSTGLPSGASAANLVQDRSGYLYCISHVEGSTSSTIYKTTSVP